MQNYFASFSLPAVFNIDLDDLEKKYLTSQSEFHPDKSSSDDISKSIEINEAYKILSDDFLRACHLLQLKDFDILNNEKAVKVDFATLEEQMELQEKISELTNKDELTSLQKKLKADLKSLILKSVQLFEGENLEPAAQYLIKAKYLKKSLEDLKIRKNKI